MSYIKMEHITKCFPGVTALQDVSVSFEKGTVTALCGENGAGKSTLGKILAGIYGDRSYEGNIYIDGQKVCFNNTLDAEAKKIVLVHQELNLIPDMTVEENIFLGSYPLKHGHVNYEKMTALTRELFAELNLSVSPKEIVRNLPAGPQQMVAIAKAIARNPDVIIYDEATSSLTAKEVDSLFAIMAKLKEKGVTQLYVSHKMGEIFEICDRVVILKDGKYINEADTDIIDSNTLVKWMVGRELKNQFPPYDPDKTSEDKVVLEIKDWSVYKNGTAKEDGKKLVDHVSMRVHAGEIVGLYGLMGAGRTSLLSSIFEPGRFKHDGELYVNGVKITTDTAAGSIAAGIGYVTEKRRENGLSLMHSVSDNVLMASWRQYADAMGVLDNLTSADACESMIKELNIKVSDTGSSVNKLSGGNQQKVILAKWLLNHPHILLLDEPTRGIDVNSKKEIYMLLRKLADSGIGILLVSSEIPEVIGTCDRMFVLKDGKITGEISRRELEENKNAEETILSYAIKEGGEGR